MKKKLNTLIHNPSNVIRKYVCLLQYKVLNPLPPECAGEVYGVLWGRASFKNKTVLDVGADYGSTTSYFLLRKARKVIAVEGNKDRAEQLKKNYGEDSRVVCIQKWISSPEDFTKLIQTHNPDTVKVDIEGGERHLLGVPKQILSSVKEWLIEIHTPKLFKKIKNLYSELNCKKMDCYPYGSLMIIYVRLNDRKNIFRK